MRFDPNVSAARILAIPEGEPERLFSTAGAYNDEYKQLALIWHPDRRPGDAEASKVLAHINRLRGEAKKKSESGTWSIPGELMLTDTAGKKWRVPFAKRHPFELGEMVYGPKVIAFIVKQDFADLFMDAVTTIRSFNFADARMRDEMSKYLPQYRHSFETNDKRLVLVLDKSPDVFLLRDVIDALGGTVDPRHAAWMLSALHNIACYLEFAELTHNAISAETCFVSPEFHSVLLLGGWWYSRPAGAKLNALTRRTRNLIPSDILRSKKADPRLDRILIRVLGRELLGDTTGISLVRRGVPVPMADYLRNPIGPSARADYGAWHQVLTASFGARRFVKLDLPASAIFD